MSPEPLNITSERTSDIEPLISTQNQYLENEESKWVGERGPAGPKSEPRTSKLKPSPTKLGEPRFSWESYRAEMAHRRLAAEWQAFYRNPVVQTALIGL